MKKTVGYVIVEWVDSKTNDGWIPMVDVEHEASPAMITSIGILLESDDDRVVLAQFPL